MRPCNVSGEPRRSAVLVRHNILAHGGPFDARPQRTTHFIESREPAETTRVGRVDEFRMNRPLDGRAPPEEIPAIFAAP